MKRIYSQGVASDGPVILCDGLPLTPDMIVEVLNRYTKQIKRLEDALRYAQGELEIALSRPFNREELNSRIERALYHIKALK